MRSLASFALQICWALPVRFSVSAQRFDYLETGSYDLFAPTDLGDQLVESDFPPPDPLASNDFSPFTDPLTYSDVSTPLSPGSDFLADSSSLGCSSSDFTQDPLIGKRLEDEKPQLCLPQRSNPDKYPGFDPEDDPLLKVNVFEPEDEEFCPRHLYSPSFLICDSGYFIDRGRNPLTAVWHLNRCERINRITLGICKDPRWVWCCKEFYIGLPPLGNHADNCDLWVEPLFGFPR